MIRIVRVATAVLLAALLLLVAGCAGSTGSGQSRDPWPASTTGRPSFYYFGSGA